MSSFVSAFTKTKASTPNGKPMADLMADVRVFATARSQDYQLEILSATKTKKTRVYLWVNWFTLGLILSLRLEPCFVLVLGFSMVKHWVDMTATNLDRYSVLCLEPHLAQKREMKMAIESGCSMVKHSTL